MSVYNNGSIVIMDPSYEHNYANIIVGVVIAINAGGNKDLVRIRDAITHHVHTRRTDEVMSLTRFVEWAGTVSDPASLWRIRATCNQLKIAGSKNTCEYRRYWYSDALSMDGVTPDEYGRYIDGEFVADQIKRCLNKLNNIKVN